MQHLHLDSDGTVTCNLSLTLAQATCLPDGSDRKTCGCNDGPLRVVCLETCAGMGCDEACDERSELECA